jgi:hypothetical protein
MAKAPSAFLVVRRDDGFGDVYPLQPGQRYKLGRAPTNKMLLKDDLCSREHSEVFQDTLGWSIRDLGSLNGTYVNGEQIRSERPLRPLDEVRLGRTRLVFVDDLGQLPDLPRLPSPADRAADGLEIRKRLGQTRYLPPAVRGDDSVDGDEATHGDSRIAPTQAVSVLYRLALDMAGAPTPGRAVRAGGRCLFRATPAEVAAVLALKEGRELTPVVHRTRGTGPRTYHKVSNFVSHEVLSTKQAVLAENVAATAAHEPRQHHRAEGRQPDLRAGHVREPVPRLLHLYRTSTQAGPLNADDLEFTLAVARQLGAVWHRLRQQARSPPKTRA